MAQFPILVVSEELPDKNSCEIKARIERNCQIKISIDNNHQRLRYILNDF